MPTKRHKNINTKTKKNRFTGKSVPQLIENVYIKNDSQMDNEKRLACFLANNNKIKNFAIKTLYFMLNYWKNYNHNEWETLVKQSLLENIDGHIVIKIGFSESDVKTIVEMINKSEKNNFFAYLDDKFLKVTAALNSLSEPEYTIYHVDFNKTLQKTFIRELEKIMMIKSIKWKVIKNIYDSLKNKKERNMYNFFIFDIIYASDKSIDSIYRNNLGNMNFFRERLNSFNHNKSNYIQVNECNKSVINNDDYLNYGIYNSTERYKISKNTPYAKIMDKFDKRYLGGPSGSTSLLYIMLFNFYKYPFTYQNKILLLGLLISDYIPLWHTIPEILLSAYPEFNDKKIPKYTLDKDPVLYSIKLLKPFIQ